MRLGAEIRHPPALPLVRVAQTGRTCLLICCTRSSKAALTADAAVEANFCTAICPDGKRRFSETLVPSRGEFCSTTPAQMHQFRAENLEPLAPFLDQVVDIFFLFLEICELYS